MGTAVINGLSFLVSKPLAEKWFQTLFNRIQKANALLPMPGKFLYKPLIGKVRFIPETQAEKELGSLKDTCFVLIDMGILALGGFCFGFLGLVFICIPLSKLGFPGAVIFIAMSFASCTLTSGGLFTIFT